MYFYYYVVLSQLFTAVDANPNGAFFFNITDY